MLSGADLRRFLGIVPDLTAAYNRTRAETILPLRNSDSNSHRDQADVADDPATLCSQSAPADIVLISSASSLTRSEKLMAKQNYDVVIGLEVHAQLRTESKLFCGCSTQFRPDQPNTQTCPVCLGLPGALPVMNQEALRLAMMTGLALNCTIAGETRWDRKQYYYPDLPKAYQISQYDQPFSSGGWLDVGGEAEDCSAVRRIRINRVHLEEDAGKNIHDETGGNADSRVDLNRTGTPLMEIVSEPDLRSAPESRQYLEKLRSLLLFLGVSDCNMQEGSLRCDANVNLHLYGEDGRTTATPIVELKNMNSFRNVELAIDYEVRRQYQVWQKTGHVLGDLPKQTRGWDADRGVTFGQREKEDSSDYRYFPDPDLQLVVTSDAEIDELRAALPETAESRRTRYETQLGLSEYDIGVILDQGPEFAEYFEQVQKACNDAKTAANWMTQDILRDLRTRGEAIEDFCLDSATLGYLLAQVTGGRITTKSARDVYAELLDQMAGARILPAMVEQIISDRSLEIVRDDAALDAAIAAAFSAMPAAVDDFRGGKKNALGPLIGMVMKQVAGADPREVRDRLAAAAES